MFGAWQTSGNACWSPAAGIITELTIAVWATSAGFGCRRGGCVRLPPVVITTWISTLLINASPFMRFDGYFILSDALGVVNLHERCFDYARWHLRRVLFGLPDAPPEYLNRTKHVASHRVCLGDLAVPVGVGPGDCRAGLSLFHQAGRDSVVSGRDRLVCSRPCLERNSSVDSHEVCNTRGGPLSHRRVAASVGWLLCLLPLPGYTRLAAMLYPAQLQTVYAPPDAYLLHSRYGRGKW